MPTVYNKVTANGNTLIDLSQDTVTQASHIIAGLVGHLADGTQVTGTGGGGSGGLVYESGTYTPTSDDSRPTISFSNTHTVPPIFLGFVDSNSNSTVTAYSNVLFMYFDAYRLNEIGYIYSASKVYSALVNYVYMNNTVGNSSSSIQVQYSSDNEASRDTSYSRYWATESYFKPYTNSTSRYWRSGRTYKWIAVWAPTT